MPIFKFRFCLFFSSHETILAAKQIIVKLIYVIPAILIMEIFMNFHENIGYF